MILAIDIGNTNTHIGFFIDAKFVAVETISNSSLNITFLNKVLQINGGAKSISAVQNVVLCSTRPEVEDVVTHWVHKVFKVSPLIAGQDFPIPIINKTTEPEKVGMDRLLNAVAVHRIVYKNKALRRPAPQYAIVIDSGTAITFDVITGKGEFLGGAIAPGFNTIARSLHQNCALLPLITAPDKRPAIVGKNTKEAMSSGIYFGSIGLVKNIMQELMKKVGSGKLDVRIILTGGDAELIKSILPNKTEIIPYLTLRGLLESYPATAGRD